MLKLDEIRAALAAHHAPSPAFEPHPSHAAVAMILADRDADGHLDVCFIRRAERHGDPWSGQVAFPGGRAGPADPHPHAVAERETFEEIGLKLEARHRIGALPVRPIRAHDRTSGMTLSPFVYHVERECRATAGVRLSHEVAHVFWVPLRHLFDDQQVTELEYPIGGRPASFPGIRYEDDVIWGLTLGILESFAELTRRSLPVSG